MFKKNESCLEQYAINLSELAAINKLDPIIGREYEVARIIGILGRRSKNNPVLIGKAGVGKTAIIESLAMKIHVGEIPQSIKNHKIYSLNLSTMLAGSKYRGMFEERLNQLLEEVLEKKNIILFIDELHTIVGAGRTESGALDAANILKPILVQGLLKCIGATTEDEYRQYIEKDPALERRFSAVYVTEPNYTQAVAMLQGIQKKYELHHQLKITKSAIEAAVNCAQRYSSHHLPDSAIDLLDEAAALKTSYLNLEPPEIRDLKQQIVLLKIEAEGANKEKRGELEKTIADEEIKLNEMQLKWDTDRKIAQELYDAKKQLEHLQHQEEEYIRTNDFVNVRRLKYSLIPQLEDTILKLEKASPLAFDCLTDRDIYSIVSRTYGIPFSQLTQNYSEKISSIKALLKKNIIGQDHAIDSVLSTILRSYAGLNNPMHPIGCFLFTGPSGVGKTELSKLFAYSLFNLEDSIIRIDMSEFKSEQNISRLIGASAGYIGYEKGGILTEAVRRRPYRLILCDEIEKAHPSVHNLFLQIMDSGQLTDSAGRTISFKESLIIMTANIIDQDIDILSAVEAYFSPEFINRLDGIIKFNSLSLDDIKKIVPLHLENLKNSVHKRWNIFIHFDESVNEYLAFAGFDSKYGARYLHHLIQNEIINPISQILLETGHAINLINVICKNNKILINPTLAIKD